jgi:hypothetical protein
MYYGIFAAGLRGESGFLQTKEDHAAPTFIEKSMK